MDEPRYRIGCAGMFALGMDYGFDGMQDEAIVAADGGPPGCEVYDRVEKKWIGPTCREEVDEARARLARA
jgi:hypothetical protein